MNVHVRTLHTFYTVYIECIGGALTVTVLTSSPLSSSAHRVATPVCRWFLAPRRRAVALVGGLVAASGGLVGVGRLVRVRFF